MRTFKKNIKYIIGLLLIGGLVWFAYDVHFKFVINEYQGNQIEKRLKKDFAKNSKGFDMISEYQSEFGNISDLQFSKTDDYIRFEIKSDSFPTDIYDWIQISAGEMTNTDLKFLSTSENDSIVTEFENEKFTIGKPWVIYFEGRKSNPDLKQILSLKNIDLENLNSIEKILKETNTIAFEKNDSIIKLRYAGHWGENYNYVTPIKNISSTENWDGLSEKWYSFHYVNGLFCGYTDW
ncbi:hypothetical protein MWU65_17145 [Cellulophaga sp. F20128]|uniref:hypothetical protein n=1 Tax=Cellulophaga sp. F20128 TaxID=2926413 RepID=UPI001FF15B2C|nr:hypothetical protein [Cellulophaga sp. F20128]MCK0158917.1 hypothetical protein [Cellulophaga sp. F20128]